ncbi:MAG: hypothetical protein V7K85_09755 [Nostoc sp.]
MLVPKPVITDDGESSAVISRDSSLSGNPQPFSQFSLVPSQRLKTRF